LKRSVVKLGSSLLLALTIIIGAVPLFGAAPSLLFERLDAARRLASFQTTARRSRVKGAATLPGPVRFREDEGCGLLVDVWINDAGAYTFAVDTGAGASIISARVAREVGAKLIAGSSISIGGLSGQTSGGGREAVIGTLAIGERRNYLPAKGLVIVSEHLPPDVDGVLDPSECYQPHGFVIDFPAREMRAFDPRLTPVRRDETPIGGAVVSWSTNGNSHRPFVVFDGGRRALVDTGSGFGLALNLNHARALGLTNLRGRERDSVRDLARGEVRAERIAPATVQIGALVLRRVPTDLLLSAPANAPILLGRDALRPFQLTFDPLHKLIRFAPR